MKQLPSHLGGYEDLKRRSNKAFSENSQWQSMLQDIYEYFLPNRDLFNTKTKGQHKTEKIFDSTAVNAIKEAATKLQENIAPIYRKWAEFEIGTEFEEMIEEGASGASKEDVKKGLESISDIVFETLGQSNFDSMFYEAALDLLVGTGTLHMSEMDNGEISFKSVPQNEIAFEEGPHGTIECHWRKLTKKARHVEQFWRGIKVSSDMRETISERPDEELTFIEGVIYDYKTKSYWGVLWAEREDCICWVEDYKEFSPWVTGRWAKISGEVRGRGPAVDTYPDVRSLNKAKEYSLKKAAIDLSGMYTGVDDGIFNVHTLRVGPGIVIPVSSNDSTNPSLTRLDTGANIQLPLFEMEQMQQSIKQAFFNDLRDPTGPVRSATEITVEARELAKRIGSTFGRVMTEMLKPILERVVWILQRQGKITPIKLDGKEVKVKFTSPLARAQDLEELLAVQQAVEFTAATAGPQAVATGYKVDQFARFAADKIGMSYDLVKSDAEVRQTVEAMQQAMEAQQGVQSGQ